MESQGEGMEEIGTMLVEGSEIGTAGAESLEAGRRAKAAGDLLFYVEHAHRLLGDVVGERNVVVRHEAPDIVGMNAQAVDEIECLALAG